MITGIEFKLRARLRASSNLDGMEREISEILKRLDSELLKKGAPPGHGAWIRDWKIDGDWLEIYLESDRYVRAHAGLLRIRKQLGSELARFRIGIRKLEILRYLVELELDREARIELKLPYLRSMQQSGNKLRMELQLTESDLESGIADRIIWLLEQKLNPPPPKSERWELIWESPERAVFFNKDPSQELIQRGWIVHGSLRGQWIYGPQLTKLIRAFEKLVEVHVLNKLGYQEMMFPKLDSWEVLSRSGHALGIYPEIYYVCAPASRDPGFWEEVMDYYKVTHRVPLDLIKSKISEPIGALCYAQCPSFWKFLQGRTLAQEQLPLKIFDRSGTSYRYEAGGLHGIERLDEFHRIELIWLGTKDQVIQHALELRDCYSRIFEDMLELRWRMAKVTPWFLEQQAYLGELEREVGTIDFEGYMPYKDSWLEFQNLSINGSKYPRGFGVKHQRGDELWSGCSGIGLDRWAAVFLAQKGFQLENWPQAIRDLIGELPPDIKFL